MSVNMNLPDHSSLGSDVIPLNCRPLKAMV